MSYIVKPEDIKGSIAGFPIEVVQAMVNEQVRQGNKADVKLFQMSRKRSNAFGGFSWRESTEGEPFWASVISNTHFDTFFAKYPKATETKICVLRTKENFKELNDLVAQLSDQFFKGSEPDYVHFPKYQGYYLWDQPKSFYRVVTLEEAKQTLGIEPKYFPDLSKHIGRYLKTLVDFPHTGAVREGEYGLIISSTHADFNSQSSYYCSNALSKCWRGVKYELMPEGFNPYNETLTNSNQLTNTIKTNIYGESISTSTEELGRTIKVPSVKTTVSGGKRLTGISTRGRRSKASVTVGHLSNKEITCY